MTVKKTVLIMGLGLHGGGAGAANYFSTRGDRVIVTDLKPAEELEEVMSRLRHRDRIRFVLGRHEFSDFEGADLIIKNPGVPPDSPYIARALERGARVETDIGIFLDQTASRSRVIIGVTGTKGKSTTASLIHAILCMQGHTLIGGNITVSVLDLLDQVREDTTVVLELSSFQLGDMREKGYSPQVAVFTNFLDDHLNYYSDREKYFEDKRIIYCYQKRGDLLVLNRENQVYSMVSANEGVRSVSFGMGTNFQGDGAYLDGNRIMFRKSGQSMRIMSTESIQIPGKHNLYNVLAAVSTVLAMGVDTRMVKEGITNFKGLPHRLEHVATRGGVKFINDSAATTPDAAVQGVSSLGGPVTLIAGGADKGLGLGSFVDTMNGKVEHLVLLEGSGTQRLLQQDLKVPYTLFDNLEDAVRHAFKISAPGSAVLLSPGFASFGMFKNEFDRGDRFRDLVLRIAGGTV